MKITDTEVLKELNRVKSFDLDEDLETYPEDERDGRTDLQMLADEVSYILSCYQEDGHVLCESLEESKEILRRTKNGKVILCWKGTLTPVYRESQIQTSKDIINEHRRLQNLYKRLQARGLCGKWL